MSKKLLICGGIGLFIALFLFLFEPFGFDKLPTARKWSHSVLFGAVTFVISSFFQIVIPKIFPQVFKEEGWRSWKEILYLLVTTGFIGAGNYWLMLYLYPQDAAFTSLLRTELITLQVGIFPISFIVFMKQLRLYKRYADEAKEADNNLQTAGETTLLPTIATPQKITLRGEGQKEELIISADDLHFIASADNYVRAEYLDAGIQKSLLIRSSLKKMEVQLTGYPFFFRCHRMYLVNLRQIKNVSGNAQGLKLHINGVDEPIPVSRNLTETIKQKLHHLSHSPQQV